MSAPSTITKAIAAERLATTAAASLRAPALATDLWPELPESSGEENRDLDAIRVDLRRAGLTKDIGFGGNAAHHGGDPETDELFYQGGFQTLVIPDQLFGWYENTIMQRIIDMVKKGEPPQRSIDRTIFRVLGALSHRRKRVSPQALLLGFQLARAKVDGVKINTHPRDLAKEADVRYQTLLLVRRLAIIELKRGQLFGPREAA